jgi:hypothetical protein
MGTRVGQRRFPSSLHRRRWRPLDRRAPWPGWAIGVAALTLALAAGLPAHAEETGCTLDDIHRADTFPADAIEQRSNAILAKMQACKGRLSQRDEANALQDLLLYYSRRRYPDSDACRALAERGIHLDLDRLGGAGELISEAYGRCGGDCSRIDSEDSRRVCEKNHEKLLAIKAAQASAEAKALTGRLAWQVELDQKVDCNPRQARRLVASMDQRGFQEQAIRFIQKYRETCGGQMSLERKEALANDEALLHFHRDVDADCLKSLAAFTEAPLASTAWNRALCGGPCTMDAAKCASVQDARKKALAARALRAKRREVTQARCWRCKAGAACRPPMKGDHPINSGVALDWDLKSARAVGSGKIGKPYKVHWTGDLNGDGIGDFVTVRADKARLHDFLYGTLAWEGKVKDRAVRTKLFNVMIGCGANNEFENIWSENTASESYLPTGDIPDGDLDEFELRIGRNPVSDIPSVCIYSTSGECRTPSCEGKPIECLDLSKWEGAARSPGQ